METVECREVREYLPAYDDGFGGPTSSFVSHHLSACGDCRSELEQYREMASGLRSLSQDSLEPPSWFLGTVIETVTEKARRVEAVRSSIRRVSDPKVIAGGALVAAGVAGAIFMKGRRKRRRSLRELLAQA